MIAQFKIVLPYMFVLPAGSEFSVKPFEQEGHKIYIYPPMQAKTHIKPDIVIEGLQAIDDFAEKLEINPSPSISSSWMNDQTPTIWANLVIVEFQKERFNRTADEQHPERIDPAITFVFSVVNTFLERIRALTKASAIRTLDPEHTTWSLRYLQDDRSPLPSSEGAPLREFFQIGGKLTCNLISPDLWGSLLSLPPDYKTPVWETLILDAEDLIHEPNAAVVLASAALESFITDILDKLASRSTIPMALWEWINNRGFFLKNPSFEEQFTKLLEIFLGKSLETYPELGKDINELRQARNSLVHTGKLQTKKTKGKGNKKKTIEVTLTRTRVSELIASAKILIATVEACLPPDQRRPEYEEKNFYTIRSKVKQPQTDARSVYRIKPTIPERS